MLCILKGCALLYDTGDYLCAPTVLYVQGYGSYRVAGRDSRETLVV